MTASRSQIVAADKRHLWHPYTPMDPWLAGADPIVVDRAEGPYFWDVDGTRYLDANGSWWVSTLGHRHPRLVRALCDQLARNPHTSLAGCTHEPAALLSAELVALAPQGLDRVFLSDNGSTAVEVAIKLCGQYWAQNGRPRRTRFVALAGAFHGETIGATSLGGVETFRAVYGPWLFDVVRAPSPGADADDPSAWQRAFDAIEVLLRTHADEIAAVVVEPVLQGAAGMLMHPPAYLRALRALTSEVDTFLVCDEVFSGLGRTGARWASSLAGISPDVLCTAKALSGGILPFAATLATARIFDGFRGAPERAFFYGHSYCGNPLGAAVAREVLRVYDDEDILGGVARKSAVLREGFEALRGLPGVSGVRSVGMVAALDLGAGGYLAGGGWKVSAHARAAGVYLRPLGDTVYVAPALNLPDESLAELIDVVQSSVRAVTSGL